MSNNVTTTLENIFNMKKDVEESNEVVIFSEDLPLIDEPIKELKEANKLYDNCDIKNDFDFVRENMTSAIINGGEALKQLLEMIKVSQDAEHYLAFSSILKALNETNRNLLELHKSASELETTMDISDKNNVNSITNNLIIGNPNQIMDLIKKTVGYNRGIEAASNIIIENE